MQRQHLLHLALIKNEQIIKGQSYFQADQVALFQDDSTTNVEFYHPLVDIPYNSVVKVGQLEGLPVFCVTNKRALDLTCVIENNHKSVE